MNLDTLFLGICNMSITASYVILAVIALRVFLKKAPKIFSFALWAVVLFRLLCPFTFETAMGLLPTKTDPIPQNIIYQTVPEINTGISSIDHVVNPILPPVTHPEASINPIQIWIFIGEMIWVFGILCMLIFGVVQFVKLKKKLVGAIPLGDGIYLADYIDSPFVLGLVKPKIYLPSNLSENEQDFVIRHEQTHIKRFDYITRMLAFVALTLHWFNPLVWLAFVLSGKDMELSCDEAVMGNMNGDIRVEYAETLLKFSTGRRLISATPLAFGEGETKSRVKNIMKYKKPVFWVTILGVIGILVAVIGFMGNPPKEKPVATNTEILWSYRTDYVGDNSAVGNLLWNLSFPQNAEYQNFELETDTTNELIVSLEGVGNALETKDDTTAWNIDFAELEQNAEILFSLIGNVEQITFSIERDGGGTLTNHYIRVDYEDTFLETENYDGFLAVYEGIFAEPMPVEDVEEPEPILNTPNYEKIYAFMEEELYGEFSPYYEVKGLEISDYEEINNVSYFTATLHYKNYDKDPDTVGYIADLKASNHKDYQRLYDEYLADQYVNFIYKTVIQETGDIIVYQDVNPTDETQWTPVTLVGHFLLADDVEESVIQEATAGSMDTAGTLIASAEDMTEKLFGIDLEDFTIESTYNDEDAAIGNHWVVYMTPKEVMDATVRYVAFISEFNPYTNIKRSVEGRETTFIQSEDKTTILGDISWVVAAKDVVIKQLGETQNINSISIANEFDGTENAVEVQMTGEDGLEYQVALYYPDKQIKEVTIQ